MVSLLKKSVVVTGAGRGIGAEIARACAALGARVVVNDIDAAAAQEVADLIVREGGEAVADASNISTWDGAAALVAFCVAQFGAIDGLVNNAGIYQRGLPHEPTEAEIRELLQVNVMGTMFCTVHAVRQMRAAGSGSIVNVTSGAQVGLPAMGVYGASKGAVASYTYSCALDLKADGIRVNAISPMAKTKMDEVNFAYYARNAREGSPVPHVPADNAPAVCFLLSDSAADVTGQVVRIEGEKLCLMTHPAILLPVHKVEARSADAVANAFDNGLRAMQIPLGLISVKGPSAA